MEPSTVVDMVFLLITMVPLQQTMVPLQQTMVPLQQIMVLPLHHMVPLDLATMHLHLATRLHPPVITTKLTVMVPRLLLMM